MKENLFCCNSEQPGFQPRIVSLSWIQMDKNQAVAPMYLQCVYREEHVSSEGDVSPLWLFNNRVSSLIYRVDVHAAIVEDYPSIIDCHC